VRAKRHRPSELGRSSRDVVLPIGDPTSIGGLASKRAITTNQLTLGAIHGGY
jgi:hypothetical protein